MSATCGALIGVSGWDYGGWRGDFFPDNLARSAELHYTTERLGTVELNASFYSLRSPSTYERWSAQLPAGAVMAVKGSRYVTHVRRLVDVRTALANFFGSGPLVLGPHLGPFLWQLPATMRFERDRLEGFLEQLPRTAHEALALVSRDADRPSCSWRGPVADRRLEHVLEVRHPSFTRDVLAPVVAAADVAVVANDAAAPWPRLDLPSSRTAYVRLHGPAALYRGGYGRGDLEPWAVRMEQWVRAGRHVLAYFNNDAEGRAPHDAETLRQLLADRGVVTWTQPGDHAAGRHDQRNATSD